MRRGGLLNRSIDPLDRHTSQKFKTCKKHRYHKIYPHSTLWWETGEFSGRKWLQKLQICCTLEGAGSHVSHCMDSHKTAESLGLDRLKAYSSSITAPPAARLPPQSPWPPRA